MQCFTDFLWLISFKVCVLCTFLQVADEGSYNFDSMFRHALGLLNKGRVIVTDRLHSSIFALLMHKPHVIIDQSYGKITKTREVAFNVSPACSDKNKLRYDHAKSLEEAVKIATSMHQTYF